MASLRVHYARQLTELQDSTLELGSMVEKAIARSVDALKQRDLTESQRIVSEDLAINRKRFEIEEQALLVLATQQPLATDLRFVSSILFITTDLERMGDHAEGIARVSLLMGNQPLVKPLVDIPKMADQSLIMLRKSLDALVNRDAVAAKAIAAEDDIVDTLYDKVYKDLLEIMIKDAATITMSTYLLWVAHNLERIADRVTNICERVAYTVTGHMEEINVSSY